MSVALFCDLPIKPQEPPLNLRAIADRFMKYVMEPEHQVMFKNARSHIHFKAFLEGEGSELITIGAILVGKILRNEDVADLLPSLEDYYNKPVGLFMNRPDDNRGEYWYLMYVNALAAAVIKTRLVNDVDTLEQFRSSLNKLREIAEQINYDFNDQGYDFDRNVPYTLNDAYRQPDSIGGYAYLMALGYEIFHDPEYLRECETGLRNYRDFSENPWYEIPNGAMACLAAAYLSRTQHKDLDIHKMMNFVLDSNDGSLHVGKWGDAEINGLMYGWRGYSRKEAAETAYSLESMIPISYLLPVLRYYPKFAREVGLYALNVASNLRWFFPEFLRPDAQTRPDLPTEIPYEALHREREGHSPYAAGDFHGQRSIYGGALVTWLGEVIRATEDPYILRLDLARTDFINDKSCPTYLYYNPWDSVREVTMNLRTHTALYDLTRHRFLTHDTKGTFVLMIPPREATIVVHVSSTATIHGENGTLYADDTPIDYEMELVQKE